MQSPTPGELYVKAMAATEQDTQLPPELVEACIPIAQEITAMARSSGVYGNDLRVGPDAAQQTRLLALVGRRA